MANLARTLGQSFRAKVVVWIGDFVLAFGSLVLAQVLSGHGAFPDLRHFATSLTTVHALIVCLLGVAFVALLYVLDLYDLDLFTSLRHLFWRLTLVCLAEAAFGLIACSFCSLPWRELQLVPALALAFVFAMLWRRGFGLAYPHVLSRDGTIVIGTGKRARRLRELMAREDSPYRFAGFVDSGEAKLSSRESVLGSISDLDSLIWRYGVRQVVLATDSIPATAEPTMTYLKFQGVSFVQGPDVAMELTQGLPLDLLTHSWLRLTEGSALLRRHLVRKIKRLVDLLFATIALILAAPIMIAVAFAIRPDSPGPVIFRQQRVGWRNHVFTIYKFRSMRLHSENRPQWAQVNDSRVTRLGRWLRLTHLDELPQLYNVLMGDMSFVGPRPERPEFVEQLRREIPFYDLRHSVVPGITGWAQVNFRYSASIDDTKRKLEYDLYYVLHASPLLDLLVLFKTVQVMLFMRGSR